MEAKLSQSGTMIYFYIEFFFFSLFQSLTFFLGEAKHNKSKESKSFQKKYFSMKET